MILIGTKKPLSALPLVTAGFYFGILQTAIYFSIEVFVTATFTGYFLLILAWMSGVVAAMKTDLLEDFLQSSILSLFIFYLMLCLVIFLPFNAASYPLLGILIFASAFPVGKFFKLYGKSVSSDALFFHENNGFVLGMIVSLLLFVKYGVLFIYFAPLLAFSFVFFSLLEREFGILGIMIFFILLFIWQSYWLGTFTFVFLFGFFRFYQSVLPKSVQQDTVISENNKFNLSNNRLKAIIVIAGFNLILLQYFIVREFSTIISANELSVLFISAAYFVGFSIGYALSSHLSFSSLKIISLITFFLHLVVFGGIRFIASYLVFKGFSFEMLLLLLFVSSLLTSSFYSVFLPKIIHLKGADALPSFYSLELLGAAAGVIFFIFIVSSVHYFLFPVYFLLFLLLIFLLFGTDKWAYTTLIGGLYLIGVFTLHQNELHTAATLDYYQSVGFSNPKLLFSENSFYHSVDVIQTHFDRFHKIKQSKISFLNGQKYFDYNFPFPGLKNDETSLSEFTYFLANLPAHYLFQRDEKKLRILILGGGSLYSISRVAPYSAKTTVVEIDPKVIESSKSCWSEINKYDRLPNYEIIVDDAKKYLKTTPEYFDLIIMDISAPYYLGSALLHNREFFELVKSKLKPDGIFSESTQGRPDPRFPSGTAMKILKAVHEVFPNYFVIDCKANPRGKRGFIMAGNKIPFSFDLVAELLKQDSKLAGTSFYGNNDMKINLSAVKPFSLYSMENLWDGNLRRIKNRLSKERIKGYPTQFYFPRYLRANFFNMRFLIISMVVFSLALLLRYLPLKNIFKR